MRHESITSQWNHVGHHFSGTATGERVHYLWSWSSSMVRKNTNAMHQNEAFVVFFYLDGSIMLKWVLGRSVRRSIHCKGRLLLDSSITLAINGRSLPSFKVNALSTDTDQAIRREWVGCTLLFSYASWELYFLAVFYFVYTNTVCT